MTMIAMRTITLCAVFAATVCSLGRAAAEDDKETTERVSYVDRQKADRPPPQDEGWIELADPSPASHRKVFILVDPSAGPYTRLKLSAATGRPQIRTVWIDFANGKRKVVHVRKVLDKKRPAFVDLGGPRQLQRITVLTEGSKRETYAVHGEHVHTSGGVASR